MTRLVNPHGGGTLKPLLLDGPALDAERKRAASLPSITVSSREKGDLLMLGIGGFTPLDGFMGHDDWRGVCDRYTLTSGVFWPIPVTLSASKAIAGAIKPGSEVALIDPDNREILA
ncbi:MAG: hypothetical protein KIT18_11295, partial [Burkholderiales bacterium]|nr:hypothetical protein [Burkholderiales bacterium]